MLFQVGIDSRPYANGSAPNLLSPEVPFIKIISIEGHRLIIGIAKSQIKWPERLRSCNLFIASILTLILWLSSLSLAYFILGIILFGLIWWAHRENLQRIKEGREPKFKFKKTSSPA